MKKHNCSDCRREAKVLLYDLEVSPRLGYYYGTYDVTPIQEVEAPILLSISWKWLGDKKVNSLTLDDRGLVDTHNDKLLVKELWKLLDECEIACGHNSKRFDDKMANYFFIKHNMTPPSPYKEVDTLQIARRFFKFDNNKLDYLDKFLGGKGKTETTYADVWYDLLNGDKRARKKASDLMKKYNEQDVLALENIYKRLLPWATNHPNMALHAGRPDVCPRCGFEADFRVRAYRKTGMQINAVQYECSHCHAFVTRALTKDEREELAEEGRLKTTYRNLSN